MKEYPICFLCADVVLSVYFLFGVVCVFLLPAFCDFVLLLVFLVYVLLVFFVFVLVLVFLVFVLLHVFFVFVLLPVFFDFVLLRSDAFRIVQMIPMMIYYFQFQMKKLKKMVRKKKVYYFSQ